MVPAGQVIRIRDDEIHGELGLLAYLQTAQGGGLRAAGWIHGPAPGPAAQPPRPHLLVSRQFTAADDKGTSYTLRFSFMTGATGSAVWAGVLDLRPDPPHEIGWLDLRTAPGEPATRICLDPPDPQLPAPEVSVTRTAHSPGELLLDVIAARILTSAGAGPQDNPSRWPAPNYARSSATGPVTSSPRCRPPGCCPRRARPRASSPVVRPSGHPRPASPSAAADADGGSAC